MFALLDGELPYFLYGTKMALVWYYQCRLCCIINVADTIFPLPFNLYYYKFPWIKNLVLSKNTLISVKFSVFNTPCISRFRSSAYSSDIHIIKIGKFQKVYSFWTPCIYGIEHSFGISITKTISSGLELWEVPEGGILINDFVYRRCLSIRWRRFQNTFVFTVLLKG